MMVNIGMQQISAFHVQHVDVHCWEDHSCHVVDQFIAQLRVVKVNLQHQQTVQHHQCTVHLNHNKQFNKIFHTICNNQPQQIELVLIMRNQ